MPQHTRPKCLKINRDVGKFRHFASNSLPIQTSYIFSPFRQRLTDLYLRHPSLCRPTFSDPFSLFCPRTGVILCHSTITWTGRGPFPSVVFWNFLPQSSSSVIGT